MPLSGVRAVVAGFKQRDHREQDFIVKYEGAFPDAQFGGQPDEL